MTERGHCSRLLTNSSDLTLCYLQIRHACIYTIHQCSVYVVCMYFRCPIMKLKHTTALCPLVQ